MRTDLRVPEWVNLEPAVSAADRARISAVVEELRAIVPHLVPVLQRAADLWESITPNTGDLDDLAEAVNEYTGLREMSDLCSLINGFAGDLAGSVGDDYFEQIKKKYGYDN
jgi:hypothetical protein